MLDFLVSTKFPIFEFVFKTVPSLNLAYGPMVTFFSIFAPSISVEFFYNPNSGLYGNRIDKMGYTLGTDLELDGPHSFRIFTRIDHKIYDNNPSKFILGFDYQLSLNDILSGNSKKVEL